MKYNCLPSNNFSVFHIPRFNMVNCITEHGNMNSVYFGCWDVLSKICDPSVTRIQVIWDALVFFFLALLYTPNLCLLPFFVTVGILYVFANCLLKYLGAKENIKISKNLLYAPGWCVWKWTGHGGCWSLWPLLPAHPSPYSVVLWHFSPIILPVLPLPLSLSAPLYVSVLEDHPDPLVQAEALQYVLLALRASFPYNSSLFHVCL